MRSSCTWRAMRVTGVLAWVAAWVVASLTSAALVGCGVAPLPDAKTDLRTASDQTNADRRAQARLELAAAYFARNQLSTALDEVKQALEARPDLPEALNLRGLIYAELQEPELAEASFKRGMALAPQDGDILHNYGWFLCQRRRFDEADKQFTGALALPQYRSFSRTMLAQGACQANAGQLRRAENTLARAFELDPTNLATAYNLSDVLYRLGDYERARFYIRRVNLRRETANAQSLWLGMRIENRLGNAGGVRQLGQDLRERFPQSPQALQFDKGQFDD